MNFLNLFREHRDLQTRASQLQDRIDWLTDEHQRLSERYSDMTEKLCAAKDSEIISTRKMTDSFARRYGGPVFDIASEPALRPEAFEPIPKERQQASTVIEQMERDFVLEMDRLRPR